MFFDLIARLVNRRGWLVVLAWVALAVALRQYAPTWDSVSLDDDVRFFPEGSLSVDGQALLDRGFPDAVASTAVLVAERPGRSLSEADRRFIVGLADRIRGLIGPDSRIVEVTDFQEPYMDAVLLGGGEDGQAALTLVGLDSVYASKQTRLAVNQLEEVVAALADEVPEGLNLAMTGSAVVGHDQNEAFNGSIDTTTIATVGLVVLILLLVYRSPLLVLIPLVTIALSVIIALKGLPTLRWVPGLDFQVINVTKVFVIVVLFGAGTDYCLFLIARYREERRRLDSTAEALRVAIREVGAALFASAGTVIVGLGMLWFSSFAKIQYSGPAIALSLAVALLAALTLAPVFLRWFGRAVDWPFGGHRAGSARLDGDGKDPESYVAQQLRGPWGRIANLVVRHPVLILAVSTAPMVALAVVGARTKVNYEQLSDLPRSAPSKVGGRIIRDYFSIGELGPTTLLLATPAVDFRTVEGREALEGLVDRLERVPEVASIRALTRPLGTPLDQAFPLSKEEQALPGFLRTRVEQARQVLIEQGYRKAEQVYVSTRPMDPDDAGRITRLDLLLGIDPFSEPGLDALDSIRAVVNATVAPDSGEPLAGAEVGYAGSTAQIYDLRETITVDERRMYLYVTLGVYAILVLLLRRPGISLYLIATVVVGYLATLGITDYVFGMLHEGPDPWQGLDWKVSFFLFVILVAIGEDYNIFLMSRVVEEERSHPPVEAVRRAVAATGGIISSCGLIMAGTFGSMLTGRLLSLRELGFALGLGVLLDTFIVRPILVPAFIVLLERRRSKGHRRPSTETVAVPEEVGVPVSAVNRVDYGLSSSASPRR